MAFAGGDFGLSEFIYQKLSRFEDIIPRGMKKKIAAFVIHTVLIFSVAGPIMTIPQVVKIFSEHSAAGLSLLTWVSYLCISFFWLNYGLLIRNKPIAIANSFNLVVNLLTVVGIALYS